MVHTYCFIGVLLVVSTVATLGIHGEHVNGYYPEWSGDILGLDQTYNLPSDSLAMDTNGEVKYSYRAKRETKQLSQKCRNQTDVFMTALASQEIWSLRMLDASGKPPSNVLKGNSRWLGSYDECKNVTAVEYPIHGNRTVHTNAFGGQYCTITVKLSILQNAEITMGLCVPDGCSNADIGIFLQNSKHNNGKISKRLNGRTNKIDGTVACKTSVIGFFMALLLVATVYDIVYLKLLQKGKSTPGKQLSRAFDIFLFFHIEGTGGKLLLSFSVYTNTLKIMSTKQSSGNINALNGIRCLSISWVVLGHTFFFSRVNVMDAYYNFIDWYFQAIVNAEVSVDSFFVMSGLLVAYLSLKEMKKRNGCLNLPLFYFHRFWRLTPPYMFFMLIYIPLFQYWGNGMMWPRSGTESNYCNETWWTNLLYVNNFVKSDRMCMGWSWYLANDMQFYWISPLIFIPLYYSSLFGGLVCFAFLLGTSIAPGVVSVVNNLPPNGFGGGGAESDNSKFFEEYYIKPYCRMGPYVIGMITGYVLYRTNCKVKLHGLVVIIGWGFAAFCCMSSLYGLTDAWQTYHLSVSVSALYNAIGRQAWALGLCWVIFACSTGYGGVVNSFLSWSAWLPVTRLTYGIYLVHPIVIYWYNGRRRTTIYYSFIDMLSVPGSHDTFLRSGIYRFNGF
ncbi:hypothetical protein ScPMuIL_015579 [Solemya velum]